jgi:FkbM family methyltransferase
VAVSDVLNLKAIANTTRLALLVRESARFWVRVAMRSQAIGGYRLRGSNVRIYLRHGTVDILTFDEIFRLGHYDLPLPVSDVLAGVGRPLRVADVGANIGLFGTHTRRLFPDAAITAFEPHPANAAILRRTIAANGGGRDWRLIEACADIRDGHASFSLDEFTTSRIEPSPEAITVRAVDVFEFLDVDFLKVDAEGAEWRLLADPRFASVPAAAVALEYHPHDCPGPNPGQLARELLHDAGYDIFESGFELPQGHGMLWGWRSEPEASFPRARPRA